VNVHSLAGTPWDSHCFHLPTSLKIAWNSSHLGGGGYQRIQCSRRANKGLWFNGEASKRLHLLTLSMLHLPLLLLPMHSGPLSATRVMTGSRSPLANYTSYTCISSSFATKSWTPGAHFTSQDTCSFCTSLPLNIHAASVLQITTLSCI